MSCATFAVLAPTEFLDVYLLALGVTNYFGCHRGPFDRGLPQLERVSVGNGQHPFECEIGTRFELAVVNLQELPLFDFVLTSTVSHNRIHVTNQIYLLKEICICFTLASHEF